MVTELREYDAHGSQTGDLGSKDPLAKMGKLNTTIPEK
jgi:hypothetical protein